MATKADFTEQEWEHLHKGVTGAGLLVAMADRGFFDTIKEAGTLAQHLGDARKNSSNELIRELAASGKTGFGFGTSLDELEKETLEALRSGVSTLQQKAPEDLDHYRKFVLDVAESVGRAAGGGEEKERAALEKIRSTLGS
jgi:tellurite resistance protein